MFNIFDFIAFPLGQFLYFIYNNISFQNYGLAIIIFTIVIRLLILPLTIKQYHSTAKMQEVQPLIQEIQKKYKNDKEKLNQELMKVYQENKVNPAGGCLPLLIQMPILFSLYYVISSPLKYMLKKSPEVISQLLSYVPKADQIGRFSDINIINYFSKFPEKLTGISELLKPEELINLKFAGLNLGLIPSFQTSVLFGDKGSQYLPLLIIPILAVITTYLSTKLTMAKTTQQNGNSSAQAMQNSMMYIGPLMTLIFSFQLPAGLGLYWIAGYIVQIFQQLYLNKYVLKKK